MKPRLREPLPSTSPDRGDGEAATSLASGSSFPATALDPCNILQRVFARFVYTLGVVLALALALVSQAQRHGLNAPRYHVCARRHRRWVASSEALPSACGASRESLQGESQGKAAVQ